MAITLSLSLSLSLSLQYTCLSRNGHPSSRLEPNTPLTIEGWGVIGPSIFGLIIVRDCLRMGKSHDSTHCKSVVAIPASDFFLRYVLQVLVATMQGYPDVPSHQGTNHQMKLEPLGSSPSTNNSLSELISTVTIPTRTCTDIHTYLWPCGSTRPWAWLESDSWSDYMSEVSHTKGCAVYSQ